MTQTNPSSTSSPVVVTAVGVTIPPIGRRWRGVFFAINFIGMIVLLALCVWDFGHSTGFPQGMMLIMTGPAMVVFVVTEWLGWYRQKRAAEVTAGVMCLLVAAVMWFGFFSLSYDILTYTPTQDGAAGGASTDVQTEPWPTFLLIIAATMACLAAYGSFCGLWRLVEYQRYQRKAVQPSDKQL